MKKSMKIGALTMLAAMVMLMVIPSVSAPPPGGSKWQLLTTVYIPDTQLAIYGPGGYIKASATFKSYNYKYAPQWPDKTDRITVSVIGSTEDHTMYHIGIFLDWDWCVYIEAKTNCWTRIREGVMEIWPNSDGEIRYAATFIPTLDWLGYQPDVPDGYYFHRAAAWYGGYMFANGVEFTLYWK